MSNIAHKVSLSNGANNNNNNHNNHNNNNHGNNNGNGNGKMKYKKSDKSIQSSLPSIDNSANLGKRKDRRDTTFRSESALISQENSAEFDNENEIDNKSNSNNNKNNNVNNEIKNNNINENNKKKNKNKNIEDLKISTNLTSSTTLKSGDDKQGSGGVAIAATVWSSVSLAFLLNFG